MLKEKRVLIYFDDLVMALARTYGDTMDTHIYSPRDIMATMQGLHHVDAVEVVRCKDCTKKEIEETATGAKYICCKVSEAYMEADDFCSYGEREEK